MVKRAMNKRIVKFGVKQLVRPTPIFLRYIFRAVLYLSMVYVVAVQPNLGLSADIQAEINKWLLVANATINVTIKFFGLDFKQ